MAECCQIHSSAPKRAEENTQVLAVKESLSQENVHRAQDKVLHCSALYGIIVLTKTNYHPTRRRKPCSTQCELSCAKAKLNC